LVDDNFCRPPCAPRFDLQALRANAFLISKGDREILRLRNGGENGREGAFGMKTITLFLITGLLWLTQSREADERGGGGASDGHGMEGKIDNR
jgi:hypothetical protein